jgi:hypothetical protein
VLGMEGSSPEREAHTIFSGEDSVILWTASLAFAQGAIVLWLLRVGTRVYRKARRRRLVRFAGRRCDRGSFVDEIAGLLSSTSQPNLADYWGFSFFWCRHYAGGFRRGWRDVELRRKAGDDWHCARVALCDAPGVGHTVDNSSTELPRTILPWNGAWVHVCCPCFVWSDYALGSGNVLLGSSGRIHVQQGLVNLDVGKAYVVGATLDGLVRLHERERCRAAVS